MKIIIEFICKILNGIRNGKVLKNYIFLDIGKKLMEGNF